VRLRTSFLSSHTWIHVENGRLTVAATFEFIRVFRGISGFFSSWELQIVLRWLQRQLFSLNGVILLNILLTRRFGPWRLMFSSLIPWVMSVQYWCLRIYTWSLCRSKGFPFSQQVVELLALSLTRTTYLNNTRARTSEKQCTYSVSFKKCFTWRWSCVT
jgi:hypothetical protein